MNYKLAHRLTALGVLIVSLVQLLLTIQPTVAFWDAGELSAAMYGLQVTHPPGAPLFSLVGRILYLIPFPGNIGLRANLLSVLSSALAVLMLFLVAVRLINITRGRGPKSAMDAFGTYASAAIGALAYSFSDTFWFNAVESNVFAASTLLFSLITWLMLVWYERANEPHAWKYILLAAYLVGLSVGVHLMSVLSIVAVAMVVVIKRYVIDDDHCRKTALIFLGHVLLLLVIALGMWANQTAREAPTYEVFKKYDSDFMMIMGGISVVVLGLFWKKLFRKDSFYLPVVFAGVALAVAFGGVVKFLPKILILVAGDSSSTGAVVLLVILGALAYGVHWAVQNKRIMLAVSVASVIFMIMGFTTYAMIIIRANQHPPINENNPDSFSRLITYLNREQYGEWPLFKRRWSGEPQHQQTWDNYSSDLDFFWRYQMNHMFNRYVLWNFVGRESWVQDTGVKWNQLWGIPFFMGLLGLYFHFRKDWKMASTFVLFFFFMGYLTVFYQNQQQWQPRERDYFYVGAFFIFSAWIAMGVKGLIDLAEEKITEPKKAGPAFVGILAVAAVLIPGRMAQTNYHSHDRSKNWLAQEYSYNLLQSCAPNSVLFTNGDNDTFPLWYLQVVEAVRRDVRIVCLSLVNTEWYIKQLKHEEPWGTPKVKITLSDDVIDRLQPTQFEKQTLRLPVPPDVVKAYDVTDTAVIRTGAITFTMQPTLRYRDIGAIRVQDMIVREIVMRNAWQRPIYFANTCGPDARIGLDDYLKMEGFAARLVPKKKPFNPNVPYYVDEELMRKNILEEHPGMSQNYQPGFFFKNLNNPEVFYDENQENMAQNCRGAFLMLAMHYLYADSNKAMCVKTLDQMEQFFPRNVIKMDFQKQYYLSLMYNTAGEKEKFRAVAKSVEESGMKRLEENPTDMNELNMLYQFLGEIFDRTEQYGKAADLYERILASYPNDQRLKEEINHYRELDKKQKTAAENPK